MNHTTLAYAFGAPLGEGRIRVAPEDFIVREHLGFEASGAGEHVLLTVRKREANTKWVARQIAQFAGVRVREVGFAGLKDRHAVTEQAFTVRSARPLDEWRVLRGDEFEVIAAARHRRKLPRGAHRGNAFMLVVRDVQLDRAQLASRVHLIATRGVPNYFGEQRFGRDGNNLAIAERWLCEGIEPPDRDARSFALSAARAALFNAVLSARVANGSWDRILPGEIANLDGTQSIFVCADDPQLQPRCEALDIHPTGPLCGSGEVRATAKAREVEEHALERWSQWREALARLGVRAQRRALRVAVRDLDFQYENNALTLRFRLTRGAFATAVLREIVATQPLEDGDD